MATAEQMANLRRASAMTRAQDAQIQSSLNGMTSEELDNFLDSNPELVEYMSVSADSDNSGIVVNYKAQPNNQQEAIDIIPPWEANFSVAGQQQGRVNLFQVGSNPSNGMSFMNNGFNMMNQNDERIKQYTNGMRLYNINPYAFNNANQMIDYYNMCEKQREEAEKQKYGWAIIMAKHSGSKEVIEWAEQFKFKTADEIYQERIDAQKKAEKEKLESITEEGNNVVYGVYDCNGIRLMKAPSFTVKNKKTGEIVMRVEHEKDALGQSFITVSRAEDNKRLYEEQKRQAEVDNYNRKIDAFARLFNNSYTHNIERWSRWKEEGLSEAEMWARYEDERIDWKAHERLIERALRTASYSRESFREILSGCCNTELNYSNKSKVFSLSYDFERDIHYQTLLCPVEELDEDPLMKQKYQQEYDIKRAKFINKIKSGDFSCNKATDADYKPSLPKPNLESLTLNDYNKPENQYMYCAVDNPSLATNNLFIPNQGIIPQERTIGVMTVDDNTGQVVSQTEETITYSEESGVSKIGQLNDAEMMQNF